MKDTNVMKISSVGILFSGSYNFVLNCAARNVYGNIPITNRKELSPSVVCAKY
jgi:hypothetical protein